MFIEKKPAPGGLYEVVRKHGMSPYFSEVCSEGFQYEGGVEKFRRDAFFSSIGLTTLEEQFEKIPNFRIAIGGMGAVGGYHLTTLVHHGFENFNIADPDRYETKNRQRQRGSFTDTNGRLKVDVMAEEVLRMNPYSNIRVFDRVGREYGVFPQDEDDIGNMDAFFGGVDLAIDGIDFYSIHARRDFINGAVERGIPLISAGPVGFSTAYLIFKPGGPNFDEYFGTYPNMHEDWMLMHFLAGVAPRALHRKYMKDMKVAFDSFVRHKPPSLPGAVQLCAGVTALNSLKILLGKGKVYSVPWYHQFDNWEGKFVKRRRILSGRNPIVRWGISRMMQKLCVDELHKFFEENPGELLRDDNAGCRDFLGSRVF